MPGDGATRPCTSVDSLGQGVVVSVPGAYTNGPADIADAMVTFAHRPQVSGTKTANTTTVQPNGAIIYTVTVANTGEVPANNTAVSDPIASSFASYSTTCAAAGGAACPNGAGPVSGPLSETIATLPAGGHVVYTITAKIGATLKGAITNTVTVTPPPGGLCGPGNTQSPCTASTSSDAPPAAPVPVPVDARWMLLLLAVLLGLQAARGIRRQ